MSYVLSTAAADQDDRHFSTIGDALVFYQEAKPNGAQLRFVEKKTFINLSPGITVEMVEQDLASIWEWEPEDTLRIRPKLKQRYVATA